MPVGRCLLEMTRRAVPILVSICLLACLATGCASLEEYSSEQFLMDTIIQVKVYSPDADAAKEAGQAVFAEFTRVTRLTDRFAEKGTSGYNESDVCRINEMAGIAPVKVSDDVIEMLETAKKYSDVTDGAFDVAIGPLMDLWGFGHDSYHVPTAAEIAATLPLVDESQVIVDPGNNTVFLTKKGMSLDLGAVAKGYAVEKSAELLKQRGVSGAVINAGGNIYVLGKNPKSRQWSLGIQDPRDSSNLVGVLAVDEGAVVTSGDYQRFFEQDGVRYHHILDPATGMPANKSISVTVVTADSTDADILSTALFVMGPEKGMDLVERLDGVEAFFVSPDKKITVSSGLKGKVEVQPGKDYHYDPSG